MDSSKCRKLRVPTISTDSLLKLDSLVGKVVDEQHESKSKQILEQEIDKMVYQLYGLTDAEIALVEAQVGR
jgi:hypothetical protein